MLMAFPTSAASVCGRYCPVEPPDLVVIETISTSELAEQPFAESAMGDSMDANLLPELSGETWLN